MQKAICLALLVVLPTFCAPGQSEAGQSPKAPDILHVTTHMVQVNVIVKDDHGHPVPGLSQSDFTIFDDGKPQEISSFAVEQTRPPVSIPPVPPDIFTNIPDRQSGGSPAVTVILFDGLNTRWEDQARVRVQILKFLKQLQPADRVGLYTLDTRLVMLHDFTSDSESLVKALNSYSGRSGNEVKDSEADNAENPPQWVDSVQDLQGMSGALSSAAVSNGIAQWLANAVAAEANYYMNQRVAMTVNALVAIADHLQGVPGRKNLVWVSSGFPLLEGMDQFEQTGDFSRGNTYGEEIKRAAEALNDVNLAIYPVDARGLMVDPSFEVNSRPPSMAAYRRMQRLKLPQHLADNFPTMDEIAKRTGGRAFYNTNDIQGAIRQVIDDSQLTYLLSYYPTNTVWNGQFHKIKVKVDRPGLHLQYRDGYAAVAEPPAASPSGEKRLESAVFSPLDATGVAFAVKTVPEKSASSSRQLTVQYWINPRDVTLVPNGNKWAGRVTVVLEEFGPRGEALKGLSRNFDFDLDPAREKQFLEAGLRFTQMLEVAPGAERVRVVVRDDPTENLGSVNIPLDRVLPQSQPARK
ncbi:MAG TPA: VWA domain-containing protein [Terriglobia bacterium]|nr:VWA domain-containing protein [Terriglobia bacterium]